MEIIQIFNAALFKEFEQQCKDKHVHGLLIKSVYVYETYKYSDHYVRWYDNQKVDCEVICGITMVTHVYMLVVVIPFSLALTNQMPSFFKWQKRPVDENGGLNYSWLVAETNVPSVSPAYLTFKEPNDQPTIQRNFDSATKFQITYHTNR